MKQTILLGLIGVGQIATAVFPQILIIRLAGLNESTDVFFATITLTTAVGTILITALNGVWLHKFSSSTGNLNCWKIDLSKSLGQCMILLIPSIGLIFLLVNTIISFVFPGFNEDQRELAIYLVGIFLIQIVFTVLSSQLSSALRTLKKFVLVELVTLFSSVFALILIFVILPTFGLKGVAYIMLFKAILIFMVQWHFVNYQRPSILGGWNDKESWQLMKPVFGGSLIYKFAPIIDRYWLSFAPEGFLSLFGLCNSIINSLNQIIDVSIITPRTSLFGRFIKDGQHSQLSRSIQYGILLTLVLVSLYILILILAKDIFFDLTEYFLKIKSVNSKELWMMCLIMSIYLFSAASGNFLVSAFYAKRDTKTPVIIGMTSFFVSLFTKALAFWYLGPFGLVFAISAYFGISWILLFVVYIRKYGLSRA